MKLNLKNPIVFFDLETTGTNINTDRIVEICYLKVYPNGNEETKTMGINPEMHIPEQSSAKMCIRDRRIFVGILSHQAVFTILILYGDFQILCIYQESCLLYTS